MDRLVETYNVVLPEVLIDAGEKVAVEPVGIPLTLKFTNPVKPFVGITVSVYDGPFPCASDRTDGDALSVKFGSVFTPVPDS